MRHLPFTITAAVVLCVSLAGCGLKKDTKAAENEVDRFHQHWNADGFKAIYDEAHANFRNKSADETSATFSKVKDHYGQFKSATKRSWGFNTDNGVTTLRLKYDSTYDKAAAVEAFIYRMTGGKPLLASYDIMSPETATQREAQEKAERDAKRKDTKKPNG